MILRPSLAPAQSPPLTLAAAVAISHTVQGLLGTFPLVKWPNDLLLRGRKLCGILIEMSTTSEGILYAIIGIGLNVNQREFPAELQQAATSMSLEGKQSFERAEVLAEALYRLETWLESLFTLGPEAVIRAWTSLAPWLGQPISILMPNGTSLQGRAQGLEGNGALLLEGEDGRVHKIVSGELLLP
jgi:BirA family biotin operon repressor/biotin-[acetyl-CoA-carboxylase] ligase